MVTANSIPERLAKQRAFFLSQKTKSYEFRMAQLDRLMHAIRAAEPQIFKALKADLGKSMAESFLGEVGFLYEEIRFTKKHLKSWMKPKRVATPMTLAVGKSHIHYEPLGTTLIISPWNYPFQLAMAPLVGAICAGNCAVVKPSELAPETSKVVAEIIAKTFDPEFVWAIEGAVDISTALLKERWDHIFYTGSTNVGKIVMQAAANHLTPVTLELGGKSPCLLDTDADLDVAMRRITWGKYFNAGQTCVAPDYLLIPKGWQKRVVERISANLDRFFTSDIQASPEYSRIITDRHFQRLEGLLGQGNILLGGKTDKGARFISPTVVGQPRLDMPLMTEEIFGPLLPLIEYENFDEAIRFVNEREKPLAFYYFGTNPEHRAKAVNSVSFGGGCMNDTLVHLSNPRLPFGGVGASGMGGYHGWFSFETFSHRKSVLSRATWFDLPLRYPPYEKNFGWLRRIMG